MDFDSIVNQFLVHTFGYGAAIVIKNLIIGSATFLAGFYFSSIFSSYIVSLTKIDSKGDLESEGIVMLIFERNVGRFKTRTQLVMPENLTAFEHLLNRVYFTLYKIGIYRKARVAQKDIRKAKIVWFTMIVVVLIIATLAFDLAMSSLVPYLDS